MKLFQYHSTVLHLPVIYARLDKNEMQFLQKLVKFIIIDLECLFILPDV